MTYCVFQGVQGYHRMQTLNCSTTLQYCTMKKWKFKKKPQEVHFSVCQCCCGKVPPILCSWRNFFLQNKKLYSPTKMYFLHFFLWIFLDNSFAGWWWEGFWIHPPSHHRRPAEVISKQEYWWLYCNVMMVLCLYDDTTTRSSEEFRMSLWSERAGSSGTGRSSPNQETSLDNPHITQFNSIFLVSKFASSWSGSGSGILKWQWVTDPVIKCRNTDRARAAKPTFDGQQCRKLAFCGNCH